MEEKKYALTIGEQDYEIPPLVVQTLGEDKFAKLIGVEAIDDETRYGLLKKFDHIFSSHVGMVVEPEYFIGRGNELTNLVSLADFFAKKQQYGKANNLLYRSIKEFGDIYRDSKSKDRPREY